MSTEIDLKEKLQLLKLWFGENPKLPEEIDTTLLKRFLKCMGGDIEETKKLIEHNYSLRGKNPQIFYERDPEDEITRKSYSSVEMVPLPGLTPDKNKILCFRLVNRDPRSQNSIEESKCFFMMTDVRFTFNDLQENFDDGNAPEIEDPEDDLATLAAGEIHIVDIANYTLRHIASMSLMVMRVYMNYLQEAYPVRLKAMHIINCPTHLNHMVTITKPFIREEVFNMIHFHTEGLESLYEHVPRAMLPSDYGGTARSLSDISAEWWQIVKRKRDYLLDRKYWGNNETKTKGGWLWW